MMRFLPCLILAAATAGSVAWPGIALAQPSRQGVEFFETKIRPVLANKCYQCHSADAKRVRGGLYLDTKRGVRVGGDSGAAIIAGNPAKSLLIKALHHHDRMKMPPKEKLSKHVIADFEQWVRMGAPDPRTTDAASWRRLTLTDAKDFWSFKPMRKHPVPMVKNTAWARGDVDRFILAALEAKGLSPVADARREALIRRVTFDLIGLPPTPDEIDSFVTDESENALEKVVDRLLASKHFGERWGRHWLDVARYAESNGNVDNTPMPQAWQYRDYVIRSFNEDKPYNRFITEQIAGDLLKAKTKTDHDENLIATGFLALTSKPRPQNNPDYRFDLIADQMDVTCRTVMAMTIVCARCHDHKFDPIPTKDYYALAGIFDSSEMMFGAGGRRGGGKKNRGKRGPNLHTLSNGQQVLGVREGSPDDTEIRLRGDATKRGESVKRGFLTVALTPNTKSVNRSQSGRLELAAWLTQPDHPLTARVMANRIWLHLFGQGLSRNVDNFGLHGEAPTHPELLDNLALKFIEDGWSVKKMIKHLVLTRTYQLSSEHHSANYEADPDNRLWWRIPSRRLEAEAIRDAMLAVSGQLIRTPPKGSMASARANNRKKKKIQVVGIDKANRSVYLAIIRNGLPEALSVFDVADPSLIVGQREVTTVPAQALYLMNSPFVLGQAKGFAGRLLAAKSDDAARINLAFRLALAREPSAEERAELLNYLRQARQNRNEASAWAVVCQTLLASAEFRYIN